MRQANVASPAASVGASALVVTALSAGISPVAEENGAARAKRHPTSRLP